MDKESVEELFADMEGITVKRMFGGMGVFHRGLNFAAVMDGVLRFKADEQTRDAFLAEGMGPWTYTRRDGTSSTMGYYQVPERLFDDPETFAIWARDAFEVAIRADAAKPASKRKLQTL